MTPEERLQELKDERSTVLQNLRENNARLRELTELILDADLEVQRSQSVGREDRDFS